MRPMLASPIDSFTSLHYPLFASIKIDGIRALLTKDGLLSRSLKKIPNKALQSHFLALLKQYPMLEGLDGELCASSMFDPNLMQKTTSVCMSHNSSADQVVFYVFDIWNNPTIPYRIRLSILERKLVKPIDPIVILPQTQVMDASQAEQFENAAIDQHAEGIILRSPNAPYKYGRSTLREQYLLKVKRFEDSEAIIVGASPLLVNNNEQTINNLGLAERSSSIANKIEANMLGSLHVRNLNSNTIFSIGSGFTEAQRINLWENRGALMGKIITYKSFKNTGVLNAPRFPIFKSFRSPLDLG